MISQRYQPALEPTFPSACFLATDFLPRGPCDRLLPKALKTHGLLPEVVGDAEV